jgi:hypothetical protein
LSKRNEKSIKDYLIDQLSSKHGLQTMLKANRDGSKPQVIISSVSEDPQVRYVRRIKKNDFWNGKNANRQHENIISQYSQDYNKKCILHQGPQAVAEHKNNMIV